MEKGLWFKGGEVKEVHFTMCGYFFLSHSKKLEMIIKAVMKSNSLRKKDDTIFIRCLLKNELFSRAWYF